MLVDRLELDPEFAELVAIKGRERILAEHTFKHRISKIINDLDM
jgi:spore maturation protein CgeB